MKKSAKGKPPLVCKPQAATSLHGCLQAFKRLLTLTELGPTIQQTRLRFYDRIFTPTITLWYMIFRHLNHDHSLQAAVADLHSGGADRLANNQSKLPSMQIQSLATTAFCKASKRLPVTLLLNLLRAHATDVWNEIREDGKWHGLRVLLLDGSQLSLRPHPDIVKHFSTSSNGSGEIYWVLMRLVATFCFHTGMVVATAVGSTTISEQALAIRQITKDFAGCLYIGDRNFGVRQMVQAVREASSDCLFRMTELRAKKLIPDMSCFRRPGDYPVAWHPSRDDLRHAGCSQMPIAGRLIVARYSRPGFRTQWIYLFTTLLDASPYPATELVELYGVRWQVEIHLRYLKTQMDLNHLESKSTDMAEKEWLAGVMAYNLVRVTMSAAAAKRGISPSQLSFSTSRGLLLGWLLKNNSWLHFEHAFEKLLSSVARATLPIRRKPRPPEPRATRHKRNPFPPLRGNRNLARKKLIDLNMKS
ncbi:MAG: IS4 family transposase [Chloroflexi bacterium]|nr:IS4 family transposase [Chloroflexota bacterium]